MKTLQIDIKTAQRLYPRASSEFKTLLEENFTEKELSPNMREILGSSCGEAYENTCEYLGIEPMNEPEMLRQGFRQDEIDRRKLETITFVLNDCEYLDWTDSNQKKYYVWFDFSAPSGFAFDGTTCRYSDATAGYASRLCFKRESDARYAGKTFTGLYRSIIDNKPIK